MTVPSLSDLQQLAERALGHAQGDETQVTALWDRDGGLSVEFTTVIDGRAASARAPGGDLGRAARAAAANARRPRAWPTPGLPDPVEGARPHDGFDPAALRDAAAEGVRTGAARIAIASTKGVRAAEQRSWAIAEARVERGPRTVWLRRAAVAAADLDPAGLAAEARDLAEMAPGGEAPAGELAVVIGHDAVASLLDHLRGAFGVELDLGAGPLADRFGSRVAAAAINLSDSPRYQRTLPRSFDAEGLPRSPVPLIQDGVAHRRVHDSVSAARAGAVSTGHATRAAALAPVPEQLVMVGGGASGIEELARPIDRGLYLPALSGSREAAGEHAFRHRALGCVLIEGGELTSAVADVEVVVEPLAVLAAVEALSARTQVLPLPGQAPGGIGAAIVPALRARGGVRTG